jgi:hypothetical protein
MAIEDVVEDGSVLSVVSAPLLDVEDSVLLLLLLPLATEVVLPAAVVVVPIAIVVVDSGCAELVVVPVDEPQAAAPTRTRASAVVRTITSLHLDISHPTNPSLPTRLS